MKSTRLILMGLILAVILISTSIPVLATGNGEVKLIIWTDYVPLCANSVIEIYFQNDAPLYEISLGFDLNCTSGPIIVSPHVKQELPFEIFDVSFEVDTTELPNKLYIHGVAGEHPLPANPVFMKIFSLLVQVPPTTSPDGEFCIDNILNPSTQQWSFKDQAYYSPMFNGVPNADVTDPSAPAVCYDIVVVPDCIPQFSATPPNAISLSHCEPFAFDFQVPLFSAERCKNTLTGAGGEGKQELSEGAWYSCLEGTIDSVTGLFIIGPSMTSDTVREIVSAHSYAGCSVTDYAFTIVRNGEYAPPAFAACRPIVRVKSGSSKVINYRSSNPNQCSNQNWSLSLLSGTAPESEVSIDTIGKVTVDALPSDLGEMFDYRLIASDVFGNADSCSVQIQIVSYLPGDANGDGRLTISDVVYIINCIFGGSGCSIEPDMDANCSGTVTISDVVYLINHIFAGGPAPCA